MIDIRNIWDSHKLTVEKVIKTKLEEVKGFKAYAATNHITGNHLFLLEIEASTSVETIKLGRFKGLSINILDYGEYKELNIALLDNKLKDIFILFIENLIEVINNSVTEKEALNAIANVIFLWKKLFDKMAFDGLTIEQQKGLLGELLVIRDLINENFPKLELIQSWTGPKFEDKDFVFGTVAVEVKVTSFKYPSIKITNERQLDNSNLSSLFLVLYVIEEVKEKGFSLVDLIKEIRNMLSESLDALKTFNDKLVLIGYDDNDSTNYQLLYALKQAYKYAVLDDFPKITQQSTSPGIYNVGYRIELSACENHKINNSSLKELING